MILIDRDISSSDITEDLIAVLPALCTVYCSSRPVNWYERQLVRSLILLVSFSFLAFLMLLIYLFHYTTLPVLKVRNAVIVLVNIVYDCSNYIPKY